jgi:hypothetical protein
VIGIDAKGRIGSYDTRGNWPRDRGYDTVSQARHLTHIHSAAPNVIGIDAKGRIGRYDARGRWHRYRGYITSSEAENLVHIDRPFISASGRRSSCRVNS